MSPFPGVFSFLCYNGDLQHSCERRTYESVDAKSLSSAVTIEIGSYGVNIQNTPFHACMSATAALLLQTLGELQSHAVCTTGLPTITGHDVRAGCVVVHSGSKKLVDSVLFLFKASLHNPVDRGIQNYDHLPILVV